MPYSLHDLRLLIARRIGLVPVTMVVMALVFLVTFRNPLAMLAPMPDVAATLLFVFGLMGWSRRTTALLSAAGTPRSFSTSQLCCG